MSRNIKAGLDYFPLDIDFFDDEKIEFISALYGLEGEVIIIKLLTRIYRHGYFLEWDNDKSLLFSKRFGTTPENINGILNELIKREFFSSDLFERYGILTSNGIQKRYFEATKRRKSIDVFREFLLVNDNILPENVNIIPLNANKNPQSKVKESKVKESNNIALCPHEEIVELWNNKMVPLGSPKVRSWHESRQEHLRARWKQSKARQNIEWWNKVFDYISTIDFLMGRKDPPPGRKRFYASLHWLVSSEENLIKVLEGYYEDK